MRAGQKFFKRAFDIITSAILLLLLSPALLLVAGLIRAKLGGPILFRHQRPGLDAQPFELIKFRTMLNTHDAQGNLAPDHARISPFGVKLRKTSLDELPSLINVLRGDMSLVGPRPLMMRYLPHYSDRQGKRHKVRPGLTGLAQIRGRNALDWDTLLEYDIEYIENYSFWLDLKILAATALILFRPQEITDGVRTVGREPFDKEYLKKMEGSDGSPPLP